MKRRLLFLLLLGFLAVAAVFSAVWFSFFAAPSLKDSSLEIIAFREDTAEMLAADRLKREGFIKNEGILEILLSGELPAGGYEISKSMNVFEIAKVLNSGPSFLWVTVSPGMRKEQIAEKLKAKFNWTVEDENAFLSFPEGQYFPDTYLISKTEGGKQTAERMQARFNEIFAPLAPQFLKQNIRNDTALKIASLIQREASGAGDMRLISGVIWNRLRKGMRLQIDAANQYIIGRSGEWWPYLIGETAKKALRADSPYNLYLYKGLPPTPICNPGLEAITAVLFPEETDCFYYLHDRNKQIHCSSTYEEHLRKIALYLQN